MAPSTGKPTSRAITSRNAPPRPLAPPATRPATDFVAAAPGADLIRCIEDSLAGGTGLVRQQFRHFGGWCAGNRAGQCTLDAQPARRQPGSSGGGCFWYATRPLAYRTIRFSYYTFRFAAADDPLAVLRALRFYATPMVGDIGLRVPSIVAESGSGVLPVGKICGGAL